MKIGLIIFGALLLILGGTAGSLFLMYQSLHDDAIVWEANIVQKNQESENVLSRVNTTIQGLAGTVNIYAEDVKSVITAAVQGRYGDKGSQAVFQMIQEKNPDVSPVLYQKLADAIEGGNREFEIIQTRKIEVCTGYRKVLGYLVRGSLLKMADFPRFDLEDNCKVISDASTKDAFGTGIRAPMKLR